MPFSGHETKTLPAVAIIAAMIFRANDASAQSTHERDLGKVEFAISCSPAAQAALDRALAPAPRGR